MQGSILDILDWQYLDIWNPVHLVQGSTMYWYVPVRTLLDTWSYEKPQNGTYQYVPT